MVSYLPTGPGAWLTNVGNQGREALVSLEDASTCFVLPLAWFRSRGFADPCRWGDMLDAFQAGGAHEDAEPLGEWLTYKEAAIYLNIKQNTLYTLVHYKKMPSYKSGRIVRFKRSELDRWLKKVPTS